jgi:hypothetical protein
VSEPNRPGTDADPRAVGRGIKLPVRDDAEGPPPDLPRSAPSGRPVRLLAGWVVLSGGPSPVLVQTGPIERICEETQRYLDLLAPAGGFILMLGGGSVPHTPPEHYQAMIDTARHYVTQSA